MRGSEGVRTEDEVVPDPESISDPSTKRRLVRLWRDCPRRRDRRRHALRPRCGRVFTGLSGFDLHRIGVEADE